MTATRHPLAPVPDDARPVTVPMRDGVGLAADVYLPDAGRAWPVLLARTPYDKADPTSLLPQSARWFADHGFAVVLQDVRGKARSQGEVRPFVAEVADAFDTLDWICAQPWCRGGVATFGSSYHGWTQWAADVSGHPALRAVVPRVTTADLSHLVRSGSLLGLELVACWAAETWVDSSLYGVRLDWSGPAADVVARAHGGRRSPFFDALVAGDRVDVARLAPTGRVPALHLGGWWDVLAPGQLATWRAARGASRLPNPLVVHPVDHGWNRLRAWDAPFRSARTGDVPLDPFLDDYLGTTLAFLRAVFADDLRADVLTRVVTWEDHDGGARTLRTATTWPPPSATTVRLHVVPGDDGLVLSPIPSSPPSRSAGWDSAPAVAGSRRTAGQDDPYTILVDPVDAVAEPAPGAVVADGDELGAPLTLAGDVRLRLHLRAGGDAVPVEAALVEIDERGRGLRLLRSAVVHRGPWPADVAMTLGSIGHTVPAGHRLRLELGPPEYPRHLPVDGAGRDRWPDGLPSAGIGPPVRLDVSGPAAPALELDVLPA